MERIPVSAGNTEEMPVEQVEEVPGDRKRIRMFNLKDYAEQRMKVYENDPEWYKEVIRNCEAKGTIPEDPFGKLFCVPAIDNVMKSEMMTEILTSRAVNEIMGKIPFWGNVVEIVKSFGYGEYKNLGPEELRTIRLKASAGALKDAITGGGEKVIEGFAKQAPEVAKKIAVELAKEKLTEKFPEASNAVDVAKKFIEEHPEILEEVEKQVMQSAGEADVATRAAAAQ